MTTVQEVIENDPFVANRQKHLAGAKFAVGYKQEPQCPPAVPGDDVYKFSWNFADKTRYDPHTAFNVREHRLKVCEYRTSDPANAANVHGYGDLSKELPVPARYKDWYTQDRHSPREGCKEIDVFHHFIRDKSNSSPFHQIFPWKGVCPSWAETIIPNLNEGCEEIIIKSTPAALCAQRVSEVVSCCMGRKTGSHCRQDQIPKSTFCNQFMNEYCKQFRANPSAAPLECACLMMTDESEAIKRDNPGFVQVPACHSVRCVTNPVDTYKDDTVEQQMRSCPPVTICTVNTGDIQFQKAMQNTVKISQNCGGTRTDTKEVEPEALTKASKPGTSKKPKKDDESNAGFIVFIIIAVIMVVALGVFAIAVV